MAGGLPEPQQGLEHLDLRPPEPVAPDLAEQRRAVVVPQLVVQLSLGGLQLAVQRLLGLGGKVLRHLLLGAPQHEGPQAAGDDGHRVGIEAPGRRSVGAEGGRRAQHAGVQELEQAPQLAQMVLDRRAAERQAMVAAQQARRLGGLGARVLDGLRLVEDHVVEAHVLQERRVAAQRAVGRQHEVVVLEVLPGADAPGARVIEHPQLGREPRRLLPPVEHERPRHHDERRPGPLAALVDRRGLARGAARFEQRQHLHRLAEAHVVGQAAAEAEALQEVQPAEPVALIAAQPPDEARGRVARLDALERCQLLAGAGEGGVGARLGQARQERVEQPDLVAPEAHVIVRGRAEGGEHPVAPEPLLGQDAIGAVPEQHGALARAGARRAARGAARPPSRSPPCRAARTSRRPS